MEPIYSNNYCPLLQISWLWYAISVLTVFAIGLLWYSVLFAKKWIKVIRYECPCGANLGEGEKCTCKPNSSVWITFLLQFATSALLGLLYFILTDISVWLSLAVAVVISGWMKSMLKFEIPDFKRWVWVCTINVGYFFVASMIYTLFALI